MITGFIGNVITRWVKIMSDLPKRKKNVRHSSRAERVSGFCASDVNALTRARRSQETLDTGDDGECSSGSQDNIEYVRRKRRLRRKQNKLPWSVVNPDENFYFNWLMVLTGCTLYNLWTAIVRQSLPELQRMASAWWLAMDAFSDIVFLLDVAVQFRTGYLEQGLMVYNTRKLAGHYVRSRSFLFDLAALTPLDLIQLKIGVHPILRFPRFIKVMFACQH